MIINGTLDLRECFNLTSIDKITEVNGILLLNNTKVSTIPENIKFNWRSSLDISYTKISNISFLKNKTFKFLNLSGLGFKKLPNGLETLMELRLNECFQLKELPNDLKVGEILYLKDSGITKKYIMKNRKDLLYKCDWLF
jgi:hypothetical protein